MKKIFFTLFVATVFVKTTSAQTFYSSIVDSNKVTILNGIVSKAELESNKAFANWYPANQNAYQPTPDVLKAVQAAKDKYQFVVFGGTWCEDTQFILPRFFKLQTLSGVDDKRVSFFAVDRSKKVEGNITSAFGITNVPTIIVMKDGKEVGRVVEYGKTGKWDVELAALLQ